MAGGFFDRNWWKDLSVAIVATTVSIGLTFGTAALVDHYKRKENRKMTALMVLSNIETWENLGNFGFIDHVGETFMGMNWIIEQWDKEIQENNSAFYRITSNPDAFPGETRAEKYLRDPQVRSCISHIHALRQWLESNVYMFRDVNRKSMWLIGLTEKEVMEFTDTRMSDQEYGDEVADTELEYNPSPRPENLDTMPAI